MSLHLKGVTRDVADRLVATYEMIERNKTTTLSFDLTLTIGHGTCSTKMAIEGKDAVTPQEALDALADWMERTAKGIRENKGPNMTIPIFDGSKYR